jgi:hypothetical protein
MSGASALKPSQLQNPHGLTREHLASILHCLGRLAELDAAVAARAIRYVVDGTDEDVLLVLGGMKEAARSLRLAVAPPTGPNYHQMREAAIERAQLWRPGGEVAPAVWIRLAHVFDATCRGAGAPLPTPPDWPSWLVALFGECVQASFWDRRNGKQRPVWTLCDVEAILLTARLPTALLARTLFNRQDVQTLQRSAFGGGHHLVATFAGWAEYLASHLDVVRAAFEPADADHRLYVLQTLAQARLDCAPVADLLVKYGTGLAKRVRDAALPLLGTCVDAARPCIERILAEGDASERHEAAQLLWRLFGRDATPTLRQHAAGETSERVRQTIEKLLAAPGEPAADVAGELTASLPALQIDVGEAPLPQEARAGIRAFFKDVYQQRLQAYEVALQRYNAAGRPQRMANPQQPQPVSDVALENLFVFVEGQALEVSGIDTSIRHFAYIKKPFGDWLAPPGVKLIHVVRLAFALGYLQFPPQHRGRLWWYYLRDLEAYRGRCPQPLGLREMDAAVATLPGAEPGAVLTAYLGSNTKYSSFCDWEPDAVWPAFAERPEVLREVLAAANNRPTVMDWNAYHLPQRRHNAFKVLAMFPRLPPEFIPVLWDLALGEAKTDRPLAQAALARVPDKTSRILVALQDGRQAVRAVAAEWLGQIGEAAAVEPLKQAFRKEKQEAVRGAILLALEACGADIAEFLDRDALLAQAEAGLARKRPKGMEWVPLDALPALHWQDSGQPVDPRIVQWWLVQAIQQNSPVCGPLVRRYLQMCRPHEAAALARFVLAAWIGHDTRTPAQEEAAARARARADQQWAQYGTQQFFRDYYKGDKENLYRALFQQYANEFLGSAVGQKGMLALVAAAGDGDCVKRCEQYIRKYYGTRLAQCRALVEVLAWVRHPLGLQVLLSLGNRFRTKSIRQAAEEHVQAVAGREGWTIDELADRTTPDAGFERPVNENGAPVGTEALLLLDYGPRQFRVKLDDDLQPVITAEEGKTLKSLPAPGKQDDADKARDAKKALTDAKKTVKDVVKRQAERLYEALCTQRNWRFADWRRYLADHPIVGRLCVRLAWAAFAGDRLLGLFRPLEDGSLTNEKDEEVIFEADTLVRLAHTGNTAAELAAAWLAHFEDYDVTPPFAQFGRASYTLPEGKKDETEINDFEGHVLTTFQLRGKATKLGYLRGEAEDGGCFTRYRKPFPSLGLQAVLTFTGSSLPEQDIPAALEGLYFQRIKSDSEAAHSWDSGRLPLGKIPPVLLSECYNDVKQIAAEGTGYEPKWREKSGF